VQDQASSRDLRAEAKPMEAKPKPSPELAAERPFAEASSSAASTVPGSRESPPSCGLLTYLFICLFYFIQEAEKARQSAG
jgi:hypothetical protein